MSIVPLKKVSIVGLAAEKRAVLDALQRLGCMHLLPLADMPDTPGQAATERPEDCLQALKHLRASGRQRRQVVREPGFDVDTTVSRVLDNRQQVREMTDRRDMLERRIKDREPWGEFEFVAREELAGQRFWFYTLPLGKKASLKNLELPWQIVHQDNLSAYVLVISPTEPSPSLLPVPRTHTGSESLATLRSQLEDTEVKLDALYAERNSLTRWIYLLEQNIARAEDAAAMQYADALSLDRDEVFAVQGWVAENEIERVLEYARDHGLSVLVQDPRQDETPPTLLENPDRVAGGADLVSFYQTPAYTAWDPSIIVLFSFSLFFAMILGDAGYGLVLGGLLAAFWRKMGQSDIGRRLRSVAAIIVALSVTYGVAAGSYFGVAPREGSLLGLLQFLQLDDFDTMIRLSVIIGAAHVALANAMRASRRATWRGRAEPIAWIVVIFGSLGLWLFGGGPVVAAKWACIAMMGGGALAVVWFGGDRVIRKPVDAVMRLLQGLLALTNATKVFGDVLSYLRLFALGLASASLAITFNQIASDVAAAAPGAGLLLQILILLLGHGLNLALAVISGVVHGLRLNFIEFFTWGMEEEGRPFRPFHKKEIEL